MKKNQFQFLFPYFIGLVFCVVITSTVALGQDEFTPTPDGGNLHYATDVTVNSVEVPGGGNLDLAAATVTSNEVNAHWYDELHLEKVTIPAWSPQSGGSIIAVKGVESDGVRFLKVLVQKPDSIILYILDYRLATQTTGPVVKKYPFPLTLQGGYGEICKKLDGDATYVLSSLFLYVYRDSVSSWQVDTTGLGSASINDISLDTAQYVYAATTNGVFKQNPDSNVWHQITNLPTSNYQSILVDRRDKIFAANYVNYNGKGTYVSTDNGGSWTLDSAGIGKVQILNLSDDAYGNTYALNSGGGLGAVLYRRRYNTPGWTRIDGGITAITVNTTTINSVGGDSVLYAATSFGLYASTDQGTTWTEDNAGIPAESFYAFAIGAGGKWFTTTDLAMYSLGPTDTAWTKVFPTTGYLGFLKIYTDGLGNIYTPPYRSSNNGSTWSLDTAGGSLVSGVGGGVFYIDEKGGEHESLDDYSSFSRLFTKPYGGSWVWDTAGFGLTSANSYSGTNAIGSDHHGYLYASGYYFNGSIRVTAVVIRRPIDGGRWVADTVGIPSAYNHCTALVPGKNGDMYAVFSPFLLHRSNSGTWSNINVPVITGSTNNSMALSVDSSGALFAAISGDDVNFHYRGLGVYFSTDTGATWKYAGLDSITVNQFVSYGDSTYAATNNGLYILTRTAVGVTSVRQAGNVPMSYALFQNYPNPFNPSTTIRFQLAAPSRVTLKIYDLLGREVASLVDGQMNAGVHQVSFDAAKFASGIYFYRIQAGSFMATKKLLLLK